MKKIYIAPFAKALTLCPLMQYTSSTPTLTEEESDTENTNLSKPTYLRYLWEE